MEITWKDRIHTAWSQVVSTYKRLIPCILVGVLIGAFIHNWIPEQWIETVLGNKNPFGVVLAVICGVPMYADIFGVLVNLIQKDLGYDDAKEDFVRSQILKLDTNRETVFVAETDESVVGFIHVEIYSNIYFGPVGNVLGLAVNESFRDQGIGKQLLATAENWTKEK